MAKIDIDTDLCANDLLPTVADEVNFLKNALDEAQVISFPDSGFVWGNIISDISDCSDIANKYSEWINRVHSSYVNNINNNVEALTKLNIEDIKVKETIVK